MVTQTRARWKRSMGPFHDMIDNELSFTADAMILEPWPIDSRARKLGQKIVIVVS